MEGIDYEAVLADLRSRRAQLDAAIAAIEAIAGVGAQDAGTGAVEQAAAGRPSDLRSDSFFGMGIADAAKKYLSMMKRPQSLAEISKALVSGGFTHASTNFSATLHTALSRRAKIGEFVKVKRGQWGLSEWYPGISKKRIETQQASEPQQDQD